MTTVKNRRGSGALIIDGGALIMDGINFADM